MSLIAYYLILLLITSYAIASGRRFERYAGGLMILNSLLTTTLQRLLHDFYPLITITLNDALLLTAMAWIVWRCRRPWFLGMLAVEAIILLLDLSQVSVQLLPRKSYADATAILAYAQLAMLGAGVIWRTYGPPAEPPESEPLPRGPVH
ncbi:hypothetical protein QO010_001873 [Caulobacter ginsengisoli]|uniref:Uncharacterized protein n=1 Tax=Caulobacter ginsengisoli TaxID=400775 RepID=A0ABU0IT07_9CAUL|nr:hypothetical protein [Caulobacter ginsengisoli]MDQ0464102.1 hypothetical protein [Caulobacter ginsengisoli]